MAGGTSARQWPYHRGEVVVVGKVCNRGMILIALESKTRTSTLFRTSSACSWGLPEGSDDTVIEVVHDGVIEVGLGEKWRPVRNGGIGGKRRNLGSEDLEHVDGLKGFGALGDGTVEVTVLKVS
ncbi:hypothetical protein GUJ93_ZPchr0001g30429 [Zizania palustris]|uniref:Uncharacterized protein n=1 Tax=Zizania palustris TaxID=103762 RepID=A0A8J5R5T1_ZIZPA|nr:hypothetical protein GUJ93_ZPchr0001g30429 [Zizania palustris]